MPMIGFLPIPAGEDPLAGFPSDGLSALYKCDETDGDKLKDCTGNLPAMTLATGVALDCAAADVYVSDTSDLLSELNGQAAIVCCGCEIITPAAAGSSNDRIILGRDSATHDAPIMLRVSEITTSGAFRIECSLRTSNGGGAAATTEINSGNDFRLLPSTHYQLVVKMDFSQSTPTMYVSARTGVAGKWREQSFTGGTGGTHVISSSVASRLFTLSTGGEPWNGKVVSAFVALGDLSMDDLKTIITRPSKAFITATVGATGARFWQFQAGTGSSVRELMTDTVETIAGTPAWSNSLSGCYQPALRQGNPYSGKNGVKLGGEDGYGAMGGGAASTASPSLILANSDGWTMQATFKVGNHLPAAEQLIASFYGPDTTGSVPSALANLPGAHFTLTNTGVILARIKRLAGTTDTGTGVSATIGAGTNNVANGLLTTFTLVCSSAGVVTMYRQHNGDSDVTNVGELSSHAQNIATRAVYAGLGRASMDGEATVGYLAAWDRPLSEAEMRQCHNSAVARMNGQDLYAHEGLGILGNGSENAPYSDALPALRTSQAGQNIYLGAGDYGYMTTSLAVRTPSTTDDLRIYGAGVASTTIFGEHSSRANNPLFVEEGSWTFEDILFDATCDGLVNDSNLNPILGNQYAVEVREGVTSFVIRRCEVTGADKNPTGGSEGSGMVCRCRSTTIEDLESHHNEEHGVYIRVLAASDEVAHTLSVDNLYCHDNDEDGLKISNEFSDGSTSGGDPATRSPIYWSVALDRIHIAHGKQQISLLGVDGGYLTNFLCEAADNILATTAGLLLGSSSYTGYLGAKNLIIANGTIRDYTNGTQGYGVSSVNTEGVALYNIVTSGCMYDVRNLDGNLQGISCSGDSGETGFEWPTGNNNQPAASITFDGVADAHISSGDGFEDGQNLWTNYSILRTDLAGDARPEEGAWNRGAY